MTIRAMAIEDYDAVHALWAAALTELRPEDDSREGIAAFLRRNPGLSVVAAADDGRIVGSILCGHDGRRGYLYHVAVVKEYRGSGIGKAMAQTCLAGLHAAGIRKCALISFTANTTGNAFWDAVGFARRNDVVYRDIEQGVSP